MFRGIYTATNAMKTDTKRIDTITNNIANAQTTGFKKDVLVTQSFPEQLLFKRNGSETNLRPTRQRITVTPPPNEQGGDEPISIEITSGYLTMNDRHGTGHYKSARIMRDEEGYLRTVHRDSDTTNMTKFGAYLLDNRGNRVQVPEGPLELLGNGILQVDGQPAANIITAVHQNVVGTINGGSSVDRVMINFSQGTLEMTDNPLNIAIEGAGFIKVMDMNDNQIKYTRHGAFAINVDGILVDLSGNPVLSQGEDEIAIPEGADNMSIDRGGNITVTLNGIETPVDTLGIVNIENRSSLEKLGEGYLVMPDGVEAEEGEFEGSVLQGYLEGSNVDIISEMVQMVNLLRGYESNQRVIRSYDDIMGKVANELGKI